MRTDVMIKQLRSTAKKHENDKLYTFDTNISLMCMEVANRLEELEKEKQEIRNKTIDEFAKKATEWNNKSTKKVPYEFIKWVAEEMKGSEEK